jgi:hypothetical protein
MAHANAIIRLADGKLADAGPSSGLGAPALHPGRTPA